MLVQDNLSVHKAGVIKQLYDSTFRHMFLPTYSSVLNPIERVWNVIKQEWRQTQHLHSKYNEYVDDEDRARYSVNRLRAIVGKDI